MVEGVLVEARRGGDRATWPNPQDWGGRGGCSLTVWSRFRRGQLGNLGWGKSRWDRRIGCADKFGDVSDFRNDECVEFSMAGNRAFLVERLSEGTRDIEVGPVRFVQSRDFFEPGH